MTYYWIRIPEYDLDSDQHIDDYNIMSMILQKEIDRFMFTQGLNHYNTPINEQQITLALLHFGDRVRLIEA